MIEKILVVAGTLLFIMAGTMMLIGGWAHQRSVKESQKKSHKKFP